MRTHTHKSDGSGRPTEAVLFRQAQGGCRERVNQLMEMHDGLVHAVVRRQVLGDLPYAEALQAGRTGLWRAILRYDPDRGWAFSTYAWTSIVHHVWRAVKVHTRTWRTVHSETCIARPSAWRRKACIDPVVGHTACLVHRALYALVTRLPGRLRYVTVARYGLDGQSPRFYREIGEHLGVSGERARQLHSEALVLLRHPAHSYALRSLLGRHRVSDYAWAEAKAQRWLRKRGGRHGRS